MKIGVHGKEFTRQSAPFIQSIFEILAGHELYISSKFAGHLKNPVFKKFKWKTYEPGEAFKNIQLFISIGGDGTLLESVSHIGNAEIPVLGINTGRLGFLATISREETEGALSQVLSGTFSLDKRAVLRLESTNDIFGKLNFGLNDFTIVKKDTSSMITIHTY